MSDYALGHIPKEKRRYTIRLQYSKDEGIKIVVQFETIAHLVSSSLFVSEYFPILPSVGMSPRF